MIPEVLTLELPNDAPTPVKFEPSIAGSVPVIFAAGTFVKFAALIAGSVPLRLPAGRLVKFAPLPVKLTAVTIPVDSKL